MCSHFENQICKCFPIWVFPTETGEEGTCGVKNPDFAGCLEAVPGSTTQCKLCQWVFMLENNGKCYAPDKSVVDSKGWETLCDSGCAYYSRQKCLICEKKWWPLRTGTGCITKGKAQTLNDPIETNAAERTTDKTMMIKNCDYHDMREWDTAKPILRCYQYFPKKIVDFSRREFIEIDYQDVQDGCRALNEGHETCKECLPGYKQTTHTNTACDVTLNLSKTNSDLSN
jgi:hypothetical protein